MMGVKDRMCVDLIGDCSWVWGFLFLIFEVIWEKYNFLFVLIGRGRFKEVFWVC